MEDKWNLHDVWHAVQVPGRPSRSDLDFLEAQVKILDPRSSRALVLGCTSEYRDLLMKYKIGTTCADYHPASFHEFRKHMKHEDGSRLVETDWRKMEFHEEFDIVLGDLAFTMLNLRDWNDVARRASKALKNAGKSFQRIWLRIPGKYPDFDDLIREHKERKGMHPFTSLAYPFFQHFLKEDGSFNPIEVTKVHLRKRFEQGYLTKDEFKAFDTVWGDFRTVMHFPTRRQADEVFSRHFEIERVHFCEEWFKEFCPTYVLSKKK